MDLVVLDQGIDTSAAVGRMFFQILGAIAEFEHALMSERTTDGLAAARARGQKPILGPRQVKLAREMYEETGEDGNGATRSPRSPRSSASPAPPSTATSPGPPDNDAAVPVPGLAEHCAALAGMAGADPHRPPRPRPPRARRPGSADRGPGATPGLLLSAAAALLAARDAGRHRRLPRVR